MLIFNKLLLGINFLIYTFIIAKIPFKPGIIIRRFYFKILCGKKIGNNVDIGENVKVGNFKLLLIEDNVSILGDVIMGYGIGGKIILRKGALIGHDSTFVNNVHRTEIKNKPIKDQGYVLPHKDIEIGENAWIGTKVVILPGCNIGSNSIIGAGAVVTKNIPSNSIAVGVPAKVVKVR